MGTTLLAILPRMLVLAATTVAAADLAIGREDGRLVVTTTDGAAVTALVVADPAVGRPEICNLSAFGRTIMTRSCPPREGIDAVCRELTR